MRRISRLGRVEVAVAFAFAVAGCASLGRVSTATAPEVVNPAIPVASARAVFATADALCKSDHGALWNVSLCGPIMLVDPASRTIVASQGDPQGVLKEELGVYVGVLPAQENIANTAFNWSGTRWTQMMWPLPDEPSKRRTLLMHELFHRIQGQSGIPASVSGGDNTHLDTLDGRFLMQLEWRALAAAFESTTDTARIGHVRDALLFRVERYRRFPQALPQEQALEANEGLAEYTGVKLGNPEPADQTAMVLHNLKSHTDDDTFVRSFAYATGPAYGLLLDRYDSTWRSKLQQGVDFLGLLRQALRLPQPSNTEQLASLSDARYDGGTLMASELRRKASHDALVAAYRAKLVEGPVLRLRLQNMKVQFDPTGLVPLGDAGTVYPSIRVVDDWGVLEASRGALLAGDWSALTVTAPVNSGIDELGGEGWRLELKSGWQLAAGKRRGDFTLVQSR